MSEQLKPCPFCGSKELSVRKPETSIGLTRIRCDGCGAFTAFQGKHIPDIAIEHWSRRDGGGMKTEISRWECPDCMGRFWVDCENSDYPNYCPHCGLEDYWVDGMRLVRSNKTVTVESDEAQDGKVG